MSTERVIIVLPTGELPEVLKKKVSAPWCWFVVRDGMVRAAGSEVCSSICWELAEAASRRLDLAGRMA